MAFAEWDPSLATGNLTVDAQHRELFAAVNELHDAIHEHNDIEVLGGILYRLQRYTAVHFRDEEDLMVEVAYAGHDRHHELHLDLADKTCGPGREVPFGRADARHPARDVPSRLAHRPHR